ncbi:hypothetical protein IM538_22325 [Cytobacillus suaedae]|nr:hypothetical protein IM538_22325 [Cytobacillus suaedae]
MRDEEVRLFEERIETLAKGIGKHLETLQEQICDRFDSIEHNTSKRFFEINSILEGYSETKK